MKIQVFLRQCFYSPNAQFCDRDRPVWFDKEKIFMNLKRTINPELADLHIIYDSHFGTLHETFLSQEENVEIVNCGTEASSFLKTLEIVEQKKFGDDTIIYFLEDDYLHRENWCEALLEAYSLPIHYVSLYDHLNKYILDGYSNLLARIFITKSIHWRTVPSVCNTYSAKMGQIKEDLDVHKHFSSSSLNGISQDNLKFLRLAEMGRGLVTPLPGYSTHCDRFLSPTIDWTKYI